ncbi:MAG: hypothetical protein HFJ75_09205 [Eggerthellaceae bacterium]|nr:hypothetical protein [Eggerthellaceae bacterium]
MITQIIDFLTGAGLQLVLLLLGLLPTIDVASLPLAVPQPVADALGALNWLIPVGDLITILTVWVGAIIAVNVALVVMDFINSVK